MHGILKKVTIVLSRNIYVQKRIRYFTSGIKLRSINKNFCNKYIFNNYASKNTKLNSELKMRQRCKQSIIPRSLVYATFDMIL